MEEEKYHIIRYNKMKGNNKIKDFKKTSLKILFGKY